MYPFNVCFTVVLIEGLSETKLTLIHLKNRIIFSQDVYCVFIYSLLGVIQMEHAYESSIF